MRWILALLCVIVLALSGIVCYVSRPRLRQPKRLVGAHRPLPATPSPRAQIIPRSVLTAAIAHDTQSSGGSSPAHTPALLPPLNLLLFGTLVDQDATRSIAIIQDGTTGHHRLYHLNEMVQGRQLVAINRAAITLRADGKEETVSLASRAGTDEAAVSPLSSEAQGGEEAWRPVVEQVFKSNQPLPSKDMQAIKAAIKLVSKTERRVNRASVWQAVKGDPFQVVHEAALDPVFRGGQLIGVSLRHVPDDGILKQSGFESGDVISAINGRPLTNPAAVLSLPIQFEQADVVEVRVERNGQSVILKYHLQ